MNYFISDMHFFHERLLGKTTWFAALCKCDEMNQQLITSWNAVIKETDHVYHLGDLAMHRNMKKQMQKFWNWSLSCKEQST